MKDEVIRDDNDLELGDDTLEEKPPEETETETESEETEYLDLTSVYKEPPKEVLQASLNDIKIELTPDDVKKYNAPIPTIEKKKPGRKSKKDSPTPAELSQMTDEEVLSDADQQTKDLYMEFNSFLYEKTEIVSDSGIKDTIPTGIDLLDTVMGGGFAIGTMGMIAGNPGSGKTMLAIQAMASAQKKYNGNILVSFLDSEEATTTIRMSNLGVRYPKIKPYNDITIEKVFKFIEGLCLYKEMKKMTDHPSVLIWDSIANTLSQREREVEDINQAIGFKARLLSILIPKYITKLSTYNISLIAVNQLRDLIQMGQFAPAKELKFISQGKSIPGGNSLKFNAFHLLEMKSKDNATRDKFGFDGFFAEVNCIKNKLFAPNIKVLIAGNFVTGFSNFWTNFRFLVDQKRLTTGAWNYLVNYPEKKLRTKDMETCYNEDPIFREAFDDAVKECLDTEIVQKYNYQVN